MAQLRYEDRKAILDDLMNTEMSFKALAKKHKCSLSTILAANAGTLNWAQDVLPLIAPEREFPIRETNHSLRGEVLEKMINGASNAEIAAEYDFDDYTVSYYRVELYKHYKVR